MSDHPNQAAERKTDRIASVGRLIAIAQGAATEQVYGREWCLEPAAQMRADLRAVLTSPAEGGEWRPIESAPCDGSEILVSAPGWDGVLVKDWRTPDAACEDLANWLDPPTVWRPAPAPPAAPAPKENDHV